MLSHPTEFILSPNIFNRPLLADFRNVLCRRLADDPGLLNRQFFNVAQVKSEPRTRSPSLDLQDFSRLILFQTGRRLRPQIPQVIGSLQPRIKLSAFTSLLPLPTDMLIDRLGRSVIHIRILKAEGSPYLHEAQQLVLRPRIVIVWDQPFLMERDLRHVLAGSQPRRGEDVFLCPRRDSPTVLERLIGCSFCFLFNSCNCSLPNILRVLTSVLLGPRHKFKFQIINYKRNPASA